MIEQVSGRLVDVDPASATASIETGFAMRWSVQLTARGATALSASIGSTVTLRTYLFLDSPNQGATFVPRLAGFVHPHEAGLFELLTSVKGIGTRKALRVIALPSEEIASAIQMEDVKTLCALPEIGKRTAEGIVLALRDRVGDLAVLPRRMGGARPGEPAAGPARNDARSAEGIGVDSGRPSGGGGYAAIGGAGHSDDELDAPGTDQAAVTREAVEVLVQLGESRLEAIELVRRAVRELTAPSGSAEPADTSLNEASPARPINQIDTGRIVELAYAMRRAGQV